MNEEDLGPRNGEIVNDKDFEKSETEIETFESIEDLKYLQEYDSNQSIVIILGRLNEKGKKDVRVQAIFIRSRHKNRSVFIISQDYYELLKRTNRANGNIYHILKPNNFRDVQNLYQDKASMDMTPDKFKLLTSSCSDEKHQPPTIDTTEDKYVGRYRLGLYSTFVPNKKPL